MSWYRDSSDGRAEISECKGRARIHRFTVYVYEIHEKTGQLVRVWECGDFAITAPNLQQVLAAQHTRAGMEGRTAAEAVEAETETERHAVGSSSGRLRNNREAWTYIPLSQYPNIRMRARASRCEFVCPQFH